MNIVKGEIVKIKQQESLNLYKVSAGGNVLSTITISSKTQESQLKLGSIVSVGFKETEVIISTKPGDAISLQNKIKSNIKKLETGTVLSKLSLESSVGEIVSIITTDAVRQLNLKIGSVVWAMIKTNEMILLD